MPRQRPHDRAALVLLMVAIDDCSVGSGVVLLLVLLMLCAVDSFMVLERFHVAAVVQKMLERDVLFTLRSEKKSIPVEQTPQRFLRIFVFIS